MEITVKKSTTIGQKPRPKDSELGFGKYLTDHMFLLDYAEGKGWHNARIEPYGPLDLDPAAARQPMDGGLRFGGQDERRRRSGCRGLFVGSGQKFPDEFFLVGLRPQFRQTDVDGRAIVDVNLAVGRCEADASVIRLEAAFHLLP